MHIVVEVTAFDIKCALKQFNNEINVIKDLQDPGKIPMCS